MASSQDQRQQERLARQRGAGTHKVTNLGFTIQPLGRSLATASAAPPPPPPPPPKASTPKPLTPIQEPPSRRSSRSASRNSLPTVGAATSTSRKNTGPSPLHEEATGISSSPGTSRKLENAITVTRRTSPRGVSTLAITQSPGNVSTVSRIETPTSHALTSRASARSTDGRRSAVAAVTPVARGKRMRQLSPDRFLTAPEAEGIDGRVGMDNMLGGESVAEMEDEGANEREAGEEIKEEEGGGREGGREREKEEEEEEGEEEEGEEEEGEEEEEEEEERERGDKSYDKNATMDVDDSVMNIEEGPEGRVEETEDTTVLEVGEEPGSPITAIKSPENRNKRRKVVIQESELEETPSEQTEESISQEQEAETSDPKHKCQTVGKKPAPRVLEEEDEGEDEGGDVTQIEERQGSEEGLTELEESQDEPSRPPKKPSKLPTNRNPKHDPKPRRRTQRTSGQSGNEEPASMFPVIVHRLGKSHGFILPPGSQRSGVNPIDVISQVSMEIIDKHFIKAHTNSERKAVESFKEELSLRFLELTDALENNIVLTARARQTQKRKRQLMTELLSIKQERGRIAVKMDDVRKMHEIATKSGENQQRISKAFEDISGTLERGEARQFEDGEAGMDGLKALIRKVSATVTGGGSDGTGLLATVVGFNKFLERAERVLSERRRL